LNFHQILYPYHGYSCCYRLMDFVCLRYIYLNLQFVKAWVNLQECINSTVTAADLQGSLTIVQSFIAHSVRGASYIQSHSNLVVATLQIKYHCMFSYFYQWHLLLLMFESASHKFTPHTICGCTSKCVQIQSILMKCESQELHNVPEQPSKDLWAHKIVKCAQSILTKCWSQECLFARHTNRENAPRSSVCKPCRWRTSKMRLNFAVNSFVFGRINGEIAPRTFPYTMQRENFWNASELHNKQLRYWTHKS